MSSVIDMTNEDRFYDSFVEHIEKSYMNPDLETGPSPELVKARGIVPETAISRSNSPMRDV